MKKTIFTLNSSEKVPLKGTNFYKFNLPTLSAYVRHHEELNLGGSDWTLDGAYQPLNYKIKDDELTLNMSGMRSSLMQHRCTLSVYHSGIKDYSRLFPHVEQEELRYRLGQFAAEADKAFGGRAWMSYVMMVGSVVEGVLFNKFGKGSFHDLIGKAHESGIIDDAETNIFYEVRELRNNIHAAKFKKKFADRGVAMEVGVTYDKLLKRQWNIKRLKKENVSTQRNMNNYITKIKNLF